METPSTTAPPTTTPLIPSSNELNNNNNNVVMIEETTTNPLSTAAAADLANAETNNNNNNDGSGSQATDPAKPKKEKLKPVAFTSLFRYAEREDKIYLLVGIFAAIICGGIWPTWAVMLGRMVDAFDATDLENTINNVKTISLILLGVSLVAGTFTPIQITFFLRLAQRLSCRIRSAYVDSLLHQDISWYDGESTGELSSRLSGNMAKIQMAMGEKFGTFLSSIFRVVFALIFAFSFGWRLALVLLATMPILSSMMIILGKVQARRIAGQQSGEAKCNGVADEVLTLLRTVWALNTYDREAARYDGAIEVVRKQGMGFGLVRAVSMGLPFTCMYLIYALAFFYGGYLVRHDLMSGGNVVTVLICVAMGTSGLGHAAPLVAAMAEGCGAAADVFPLIDRRSRVVDQKDGGKTLEACNGHVTFENITFAYPVRGDRPVLNNFNLDVPPGQTVALVGASGCGKSTTVSLLERFYDCDQGRVALDGVDVRDLRLSYLRDRVVMVSQMPTLFPFSIYDNITLGQPNITRNDVEAAAKMANAHNFIMTFPQGYDTLVGDQGTQLSGGQRQRIAIARALVRNPSVLLLDEATSALDHHSERAVQQALDRASVGRTTIVIAHRLSTVRRANKIVVMEPNKGIVEQGTHRELVAMRGAYYALLRAHASAEKQRRNSQRQVPEDDNATNTDHEDDDDEDEDEDEADSEILGTNDSKHDNTVTPTTATATTTVAPTTTHLSAPGSPILSPRRTPSPVRSDTHTDTSYNSGNNGHGNGNSHGDGIEKSKKSKRSKRSKRHHNNEEDPESARTSMVKNVEDEDDKVPIDVNLRKWVAQEAKQDWPLYLVSVCGAILESCMWPTYSIILSEAFNVIRNPYHTGSDIAKWVYAFLILAALMLTSTTVRGAGAAIAGENLTKRTRAKVFWALMHQTAPWHEKASHGRTFLLQRLSDDCVGLRNMLGDTLVVRCVVFSSFCIGVGVALYYCWRVALIVLACLPIVAFGMSYRFKFLFNSGFSSDFLYKGANEFASHAIHNIRIVYSLNANERFVADYRNELDKISAGLFKKLAVAAFIIGASEFITFAMWSLAFFWGATVVDHSWCEFSDMFKAILGVLIVALMGGVVSAQAPDATKALASTKKIYRILEDFKNMPPPGKFKQNLTGAIEFKNVEFSYPSRPGVTVLNGLSLNVAPGKTIALVGHSGCGKSTIVSLLLGYYKHSSGTVKLDGVNIGEYNVDALRDQIAVVSQEPQLFRMSIANNIAYGMERPVTHDQIVHAATLANAHNFIMALPNGYETVVGELGLQLSGGQRQRVAIARAFLRRDQTRILLLDEATSALDSESEVYVQQALDRIRAGLTTIVIAHRLSTIQDADMIHVVDKGVIIESGTHLQLLAKGGSYYQLVAAQMGAGVAAAAIAAAEKEKEKEKEMGITTFQPTTTTTLPLPTVPPPTVGQPLYVVGNRSSTAANQQWLESEV